MMLGWHTIWLNDRVLSLYGQAINSSTYDCADLLLN